MAETYHLTAAHVGSYTHNAPSTKVKAPLKKVLELSKSHPVPFPIDTARLQTLLKSYPWPEVLRSRYGEEFNDKFAQNLIDSTYPIIHEELLPLLVDFIKYKRKSTQKVERKYYKHKTPYDLLHKLLYNRPMTFVGSSDTYLLEDETFGAGDHFERVGTDSLHNPSMSINKLNSYDEMKLAALVGVSSRSHFINTGTRANKGDYGDGESHELLGVIVGQVGPRFQRANKMDWQDFLVTKKQNTKMNGYGTDSTAPTAPLVTMWARLWGVDSLPTYDEMQLTGRSYDPVPYREGLLFDKDLFKRRIEMMADVLLLEADSRAKEIVKRAYVHVVGLGLGVWLVHPVQTELYIEAWATSIEKLSHNGVISNIAFIDFSWIKATQINGVGNDEHFPGTDITVRFSYRDMHARVPDNCILVCNFAWDSNSPPGNEFWSGSLHTSADPAAACSSGVAELQNARINPRAGSGACVRVASVTRGVLPLQEYINIIKETVGEELEEESPVDKDESDEDNQGDFSAWWKAKVLPFFGKKSDVSYSS